MSTQSFASELYSDSASFGRIYAWISAVIGTLISIGMTWFGVNIINHKSHLRSVIGEVTKVYSDGRLTKNSDTDHTPTYKFDVTYEIDGTQTYVNTFSSTDLMKVGEKATVWYDPAYPEHSEYNPVSTSIGWILVGFALLICISVWAWVWLTKHSKFAASAGGVSAVAGMFTSL